MKKSTPFQVMPSLESWEYEALKQSIKTYGVLLPIVFDETGTCVDGHHRLQACLELGIKDYPSLTIGGLSTEEKRNHALLLNLVRRKLTRKQMREIIAAEIRHRPDISNNWLAEMLGTTDKTVESVRSQLYATSEIPKFEKFRCKDGKLRRKTTRVVAFRSRDLQRVRSALGVLEDQAPKRPLLVHQLERIARRCARAKNNTGVYRRPSAKHSIRLYHSRFQDLIDVAQIKPGTVDLVLTDVPYDVGFSAQFGELAKFSASVLREGGVCVLYTGVVQLADCIQAFAKHLAYQAMAFTSWSGNGTVIQKVQCVVQTTPVLIFSKGKNWARSTRWYNVYYNKTAEHDLHVWQKPLSDTSHWLMSFSDPNDLVCDPLCGSGTTAAACKMSARRFVGGDADLDAVRLAQRRTRQIGPLQLSDHTFATNVAAIRSSS